MMTRRPAPLRLLTNAVKALLLMVRGAFAASVGAVILAGLPWGLIRYIGWPLPHQVPSLGQLQTDLTSPILGDQVYLNAIAIVLWFLWLLLVISFLAELGAQLRRAPRPSLPAMSPFQALAFVLLTAIGLTALMARVAAPAQAATATLTPARSAPVAATAPARPGPAADTLTATPSGPSLLDPAERVHTVKPGESLFEIAQADYGNGQDWPTLASLNQGVAQADGQKLTDPNLIQPGWRLLTIKPSTTTLPAPPAPAPAAGANSAAGDTTTPPTAPTTAAPTPDRATGPTAHTAPAAGAAATTPAATVPATPTGTAPAPARSAAPASARSTPPGSEHHGDTQSHTADEGWVRLAEGGALAGSVLLALAAALEATRRHRRRFASPYWPVRVVGDAPGAEAMPLPLRPAHCAPADPLPQIDEIGEIDEFGAPQQNPAPIPRDEAATGTQPAVVELSEPGESVEATTAGEVGGEGLGRCVRIAVAAGSGAEITLDQLGPGLGLSGPGALGAARAIALATVSSATPERAGARLLISRPDAALLLETTEEQAGEILTGVPGVELADDIAQAADYLDEYLTYRARQLDEHECESLDHLAAEHGDLEEHPPLVLLGVARADSAGRLAASLAAGSHLRAHAVLLGAHPAAATWSVEAGGRASGPGLLGEPVAYDLPPGALHHALALLAAADGHAIRDHQPHQAPDPTGPLAEPAAWDDADTATAEPDQHDPADEPAEPAITSQDEPTTCVQEMNQDRDQERTGGQNTAEAPAHPDEAEQPGPAVIRHLPLRPHEGQAAVFEQVQEITRAFAAATVRVRVLGPLVVESDTGPVLLKRGAVRQLAGRLAVMHRRRQTFEELAVLWPDLPPKSLQSTRKNAASELRAVLREHTGTRAAQFVLTEGNNTHRFEPTKVAIDLDYFDRLRRHARRASDPAERAAAAHAALALYDGDLLAGSQDDWVIAPRAAARRDALATATLLGQLAERTGDLEEAVGWWERAREIDENEEVYRQIMRIQAHLGRRADVIATRDLLIAHLELHGEYLSPATERLLAEILSDRFRPSHATRHAAA
jgi:DNA-binding SARP family transcriptional activator